MKSIINMIKARLFIKGQKENAKTEYTDLAPIDEITNGDEYLNALEWALSNERVKNIALAGPYGAGKSSIIETYLKKNPMVKETSLRISMATFVENAVNEDETSQKVDIGEDEIERGILKQLFYKVDYKKIPQSRYRKLHKIGWKHIWAFLIGLSIIITLLEYIFFPEVLNSSIDKILTAGYSIKLPCMISLLLFGVLILGILAVVAVMYRSILSHFKVKEIKLPVDATVKSEEDSNETVFNKNMDEIVYFFEETKYRLVFFEDLDRLEDSSIFVHLRELNTLLNNYDVIKEPIVFVYAVKDDIFSDTDRTKFFDFIIPVIPIINSTNSGEIFLEKLDVSSKMGIKHEISQSFVLDISPYISDMRILQNIYNEFVVYKKTLRTEQDLKLLDEPMMALIIFKNLYPRHFANIQMERGIIKQAFTDKLQYLTKQKSDWQNKIDQSTDALTKASVDTLRNIKELKIAMMGALTGWQGVICDIGSNIWTREYSASTIMNDGFDMSAFCRFEKCNIWYKYWNGGETQSSIEDFQTIFAPYYERWNYLRDVEEKGVVIIQQEIDKLKKKMHNISGWSLKRLIEQFGADEVLSSEVKKYKLLVFLLRRGYIDEKYANYINYFKGNSITKDDMNFILAVKNMEPQPLNYSLTKTSMVVQRLQVYEFEQKAIYNFDLLECVLSSNVHREKLNAFINQLADGDEKSWKLVDEFVDLTEHQSDFIKLLASVWSDMWGYVVKNVVLAYERKIHYLSLLISNADIEAITSMNANGEMSGFIEQNEDILQQLASVENSKVIASIKALHVMFSKVSIENVHEDVLDYIFDKNCYELNTVMIQNVVEYKNKAIVPELKTKNYTTIIKLNYAPLIEYVRGNLSQYIEKIVLTEQHVFDAEEQIVDLLERSIDEQMLCIRIIQHEEFCMKDITCCCSGLITEKKTAVKVIWDTMLKNNKVFPTWENINSYWGVYKFTQDLLAYIEQHTEDLVGADSLCIGDDFIRGFIDTEIADGAFEILLPCIRMEDFNINLDSVSESKVSIMISCRYFEFTVVHYEEIKKSFPTLCVEFILQNQADYIAIIDSVPMDSNLLENLLFSDRIKGETTKIIFDTYGSKHMTNKIAGNLQVMGVAINLEIFNAAWECLDESGKKKLLLEYLELLDADALHTCFIELDKWYAAFLDRSKQHVVELANTSDNQRLAERLKSVDYITSYSLKDKKEYDAVIEAERVTRVISCRVKVIK